MLTQAAGMGPGFADGSGCGAGGTNGGIAGKIVKVADDFVVLEVSDTVELKFQKGAIAATLPKGTLKAI